MNRPLSTEAKDGALSWLLLLTGFFFLLEISYFIQCNRAYLSLFIFVSNKLSVPITILPGVLFFILAQLLLHLAFCFAIYLFVVLIDQLFHFSPQIKLYFIIGSWMFALITLLTANQFYFPNSKFSALTTLLLFDQQVAKYVLLFLSGIWSIAAFFAIAGLIKILRVYLIVLIALLIAFSTFVITLAAGNNMKSLHVATAKQPNIIIIGVDSLRPDFLGYFGSDQATPFIDAFLRRSTVFSEAVTPLARTFPAWAGILTGRYPNQINIRTDLASQTGLQLGNTLPAILQRQGYETIFATDETRFSNIDTHFGFTKIISPPLGLNDFLIGNFNDFPLSNLMINTILGKWLFPYSYANRPVYFTYDPDSFLHLLRPILNGPAHKPLFLAVHFCLPHYPYIWASININGMSMTARYAASIKRVDVQLQDFFSLLRKAHLLDHAIVVLLSDHGEALELPGDRITEKGLFVVSSSRHTVPQFYPPNFDEEGLDQSAGHGTDVLGLPQYHALLAFRFYGTGAKGASPYQPGRVPGVVSLLDIKPTLLGLLHIAATAQQSGQSLLPFIAQETPSAPLRHIFLESDFSPQAIRTVFPEERKVVLENIDLYQIDPSTTRLTVKNARMVQIIESKQYADIYGEWMLALYPQSRRKYVPILINLHTGQWTDDLHSPFALRSPGITMLQKLKAFYGSEIGSIIHNA